MPVDVDKYTAQTKYHLIIWFFVLLFSLGLGLIWLFYGGQAALLGFFCLLATAIPIGLIALVLLGLDKISGKGQKR